MKISGQKNIEELLLQLLEDNTSKKLYSILIGKPVVYYFGEDFAEEFMQLRVEKDIYLKSLRFTRDNFDSDQHKDYAGYNKEIKHVQSDVFTQSIFLCDGNILVFDMKKMQCEVIKDESIFKEYLEKFNNIWEGK